MPDPAAPPSRTPFVGEQAPDEVGAGRLATETPGEAGAVEGPSGSIAFDRRGQGAPLVLLHPLALSRGVWHHLAARLARTHDVICVDARGHGASDWDGSPFTIEDMAEDVAAVLDGLGLASAHLIGMSMGGSVAMTFAGLYPARVDGMVLASTTAWYGPDAAATWEDRAQRALLTPRVRQIPFQVDRWFTEGFRARQPGRVHEVVTAFLQTSSRAHATASRAMGALDSRQLLPNVTAPVLVLSGEEDYATPAEMGEYVAQHVQHGRALTLPATRHLSLIERLDLADLVLAHLQGAHELPDLTGGPTACACLPEQALAVEGVA
jgi:3-oxoadipate enol-lactonase